jgi:hypothetical protein
MSRDAREVTILHLLFATVHIRFSLGSLGSADFRHRVHLPESIKLRWRG